MANILAIAGPNSKFQQPDAKPAGFLAGLWHGIILPLAFIIRLFNPNVGIYEINNNGRWYDFGFFLGLTASFGGGTETVQTVYVYR
ncbi:MAG: hypothetical protein JXR84_24625 [Anaerolineae bacterium]|nr:hypothetical protein [Anaerolineae bacterium]